ncbi:MAG: alpha/beta hydrolase [Pseudomonadales bacterium]|nr:alpha/beta hydrolase [Pseudomonadales bacterium]
MIELDAAYTPPANGDPAMADLDIYYVPDGKPKKLLVFIHGGSWIGGDKDNLRDAESLVDWFLNRDFVVAAPNFRLATPIGQLQEVTYKEQLTDIAHALAWLNENSATYGFVQNEFILMGFSSGAHLAPMLSTNQVYLQSVGLETDYIKGTISLDVHAYDVPYALQIMEGSVVAGNIPFIKHLFGDTEDEQLQGSPSSYVLNALVPPSLIISAEPSATIGSHGYITSRTGKRHAQLLSDFGNQAAWEHYDDETHLSLVTDFGTDGDNPTKAVANFLDSLNPSN